MESKKAKLTEAYIVLNENELKDSLLYWSEVKKGNIKSRICQQSSVCLEEILLNSNIRGEQKTHVVSIEVMYGLGRIRLTGAFPGVEL